MENCPWCNHEPEVFSNGQFSEVFCVNPDCLVRPTTGKCKKDTAIMIWNNMLGATWYKKQIQDITAQLVRMRENG